MPNNHIPTQNLYYNPYYPNLKYLIIGYMDPLGYSLNPKPYRQFEVESWGFVAKGLGSSSAGLEAFGVNIHVEGSRFRVQELKF